MDCGTIKTENQTSYSLKQQLNILIIAQKVYCYWNYWLLLWFRRILWYESIYIIPFSDSFIPHPPMNFASKIKVLDSLVLEPINSTRTNSTKSESWTQFVHLFITILFRFEISFLNFQTLPLMNNTQDWLIASTGLNDNYPGIWAKNH